MLHVAARGDVHDEVRDDVHMIWSNAHAECCILLINVAYVLVGRRRSLWSVRRYERHDELVHQLHSNWFGEPVSV